MALPKTPEPVPAGPPPVVAPAPVLAVSTPPRPVADRARPTDVNCLAKAVYYEARGESADGQAAVAQVVLNRTHRPSYPRSVCAVVFQGVNQGGCQFSFVCDGAMRRPLEPVAWTRARRVASTALGGHVMTAVGKALSFHVASLGAPSGEIARIGSHVFFMPGRPHGGSAQRPARLLRFAIQPGEAPAAAGSATSVARDVVATVPVVVASNTETAPSQLAREKPS